MARPRYHRDLLGTAFAIAGASLVLAFWSLDLPLGALVAAFGVSTCLATWLARHLYPELAAAEAGFAAGLVVLVLVGVRSWHVSSEVRLALVGWAALATVIGGVSALVAAWLPRRKAWQPRAVMAGFIVLSAQLVPAGVMVLVGAPEGVMILASLSGGVFGGLVAVRVVPEARPATVFGGATLVLLVLVGPPVIADGNGSLLAGLAAGTPVWASVAALGAWIGMPRSRAPHTPPLPEARVR